MQLKDIHSFIHSYAIIRLFEIILNMGNESLGSPFLKKRIELPLVQMVSKALFNESILKLALENFQIFSELDGIFQTTLLQIPINMFISKLLEG